MTRYFLDTTLTGGTPILTRSHRCRLPMLTLPMRVDTFHPPKKRSVDSFLINRLSSSRPVLIVKGALDEQTGKDSIT